MGDNEIYDLFTTDRVDQFENELIKSRRLFLNAKKGKNALFDTLKLKSKTLDMLILILQNNKKLIKTEDLLCLDTLTKMTTLAKHDKVLFDSILRKVKTVATCLIKNQIYLQDSEKFKLLANFIVDIMNTHFEQSFLQQIIDLLKIDEKFFNIVIDLIFQKFFLGRNTLIKNNDLRMIIKNTLSQYGPIFWTEKLLKFLNVKSEGGARTAFQISQAFNLLTFILEISSSKILSVENFKEKLQENDFVKITRKLIVFTKAHLAEDGKEEEKEPETAEDEKEKDEDKKKKKNKKNKKKKMKQKKNSLEMVLLSMGN